MKHQFTTILLENFTTAVWLLKSSYVVVVNLLSEAGVVAALDVDDNVLDVSVARPAVLLGDAHAVHAAGVDDVTDVDGDADAQAAGVDTADVEAAANADTADGDATDAAAPRCCLCC